MAVYHNWLQQKPPGRFCDPQHRCSGSVKLIGSKTIGYSSSAFHHAILLPGGPVSAVEEWQDLQQEVAMNCAKVCNGLCKCRPTCSIKLKDLVTAPRQSKVYCNAPIICADVELACGRRQRRHGADDADATGRGGRHASHCPGHAAGGCGHGTHCGPFGQCRGPSHHSRTCSPQCRSAKPGKVGKHSPS